MYKILYTICAKKKKKERAKIEEKCERRRKERGKHMKTSVNLFHKESKKINGYLETINENNNKITLILVGYDSN